MTKPFKLAIIGAGYMAGEHARAFADLDDVTIVGVCGRSKDRAEALAAIHGVPSFDSIAAMYEATEADGVVVAVNELSMRTVVLDAIRFPWACLLEKPVGLDLPEAIELTNAAKAAGARAYVALNRRSHASTRAALAMLDPAGPPRLVSVQDQQDMAVAREIGHPEAVIANWMYANSIHLVDYFSVFCRGTVLSIDSSVPWTADAARYVVATVHYDSGDVGVYQAVWDGPGPWAVAVTDPSFRLEMRPLEALTAQKRGERRATPVEFDAIDTDFKPGLRVQAAAFLAAARGEVAVISTLEMATASMTLCAEIYGLKAPRTQEALVAV